MGIHTQDLHREVRSGQAAGGTAPEGHTAFVYEPYVDSKTGVVEKGGIPFGADITLKNFEGTPPENTYFAGWSLTDPRTVEDKDSIDTYGAGAVVNSTMLGVTEDDKESHALRRVV